jgi:hypothetical protein
MKIVLRVVLILILLAAAAIAGYWFFGPEAQLRSPWEFVDSDFIYAVESDRPINDWRDLSKTEVWQYLKTNDFFAEIEESADYGDSLLSANEQLLKFVKLGNMVISAHMTPNGPEEYDFAIMIDLVGNTRLVNKFKHIAVPLMEKIGYEVKTDQYFTLDIYDLYDPVEKESMYLAAVDNVMIISYTKDLVKKAITQSEQASIKEDPAFSKVEKKTDKGELYNLYINYATINDMLGAYASSMPETLQDLDKLLTFSAMDLSLKDDMALFKGYTLQNDSFPSYLSVFADVGQGNIRGQNVLPDNTAMFTSIGFDDFSDFYARLMNHMKESDPAGYDDLQKNLQRTQKLLKIDFEEDFFSWMNEEVVSAIIPRDAQGREYAYYAMLHFDDEDKAMEKMDYVLERIRKRTPLKFEEVDYRGFTIKYLELNGFFKLFFKKLFSQIEKPHFTYIDDYVVFSNDTTALINVIEKYLNQETLSTDDDFQDFMDNFSGSSNVFNYIQMENFYGYLYNSLDAETRRDLRKNRQYVLSFPHIGFQLYPSDNMYKMDMYGAFEKPQ